MLVDWNKLFDDILDGIIKANIIKDQIPDDKSVGSSKDGEEEVENQFDLK